MMSIQIIQGLPFVKVTIEANNQELNLDFVLLDTGSATSVFKTDDLGKIGIFLKNDDEIHKMVGVGGDEYVFEKQVDIVRVGELVVSPFTIQMGAMDYGMKINGIIGSDFLLKTNAKIDFETLTISK